MPEPAARQIPVEAADGHRWSMPAWTPDAPDALLLWLPALGVAARHYEAFARTLAARGVAVFVHEWRGHGSSSVRASRNSDWGYRELLTLDLPTAETAMNAALPSPAAGTIRVIVGGHSLGGQLACCRLALDPSAAHALWLVATGAPYWRAFPAPTRYWLPAAYGLLPRLADVFGALPGRRIGFGGREARGVMHDWARSAISGSYRAAGLTTDLDRKLAEVSVHVRTITLQRDWLAPEASLDYLLDKMPRARVERALLGDATLGIDSDHFAWLRRPQAVVDALLA